MNIRCLYCGNSYSLGRVEIEGAVAAAGGDKNYSTPCPRCRRVNKVPIDRLRRTLPPGWTPEPQTEAQPAAGTHAPAGQDEVASQAPEPSAAQDTEAEAMEAEDAPPARKQGASRKRPAAKATAKKSAAKKTTAKSSAAQKTAASSSAKSSRTAAKSAAKKTSRKQAKP